MIVQTLALAVQYLCVIRPKDKTSEARHNLITTKEHSVQRLCKCRLPKDLPSGGAAVVAVGQLVVWILGAVASKYLVRNQGAVIRQ
jgi:hypothetical protein